MRKVLGSGRRQGEDLRRTGRPATTEGGGGAQSCLWAQWRQNLHTRGRIWHVLAYVFESQRDKRLLLQGSNSGQSLEEDTKGGVSGAPIERRDSRSAPPPTALTVNPGKARRSLHIPLRSPRVAAAQGADGGVPGLASPQGEDPKEGMEALPTHV